MKNKKLIALAAAGVLAVTAVAGGTIAYFTDTADATNVITMGHVDINLNETWNELDGLNVKPNAVLDKEPEITLAAGSENAYIRAKIDITGDLNDAEKAQLLAGINIQDDWTLSEGYYYFNNMFEKAEGGLKSAVLFTQVHIPEVWNNDQANKTFNIIVTAEAVQADNFTPRTNASGLIDGWYMSDGNPVTPSTYNA